jgi:hypothetical protein
LVGLYPAVAQFRAARPQPKAPQRIVELLARGRAGRSLLARRLLHKLPAVEEPPGVVLRPAQPLQYLRLLLGQLLAKMLQGQFGLLAGVIEVGLFGRRFNGFRRRSGIGLLAGLAAGGRIARTLGSRSVGGLVAGRAAVFGFLLRRALFGGVACLLRLLSFLFAAGLFLAGAFAFARLLLGGAAGGLLGWSLVARLGADLALSRFVRLGAALIGGRVRARAAGAGLVALLTAALLAATLTITGFALLL